MCVLPLKISYSPTPKLLEFYEINCVPRNFALTNMHACRQTGNVSKSNIHIIKPPTKKRSNLLSFVYVKIRIFLMKKKKKKERNTNIYHFLSHTHGQGYKY